MPATATSSRRASSPARRAAGCTSASNDFRSDRATDPLISRTALAARLTPPARSAPSPAFRPARASASASTATRTASYDRDELDAGTDPTDPTSVPGGTDQLLVGRKIQIKNRLPDEESQNQIVVFSKDPQITIPVPGSIDDPRCGGSSPGTVKARITVRSAASGEEHTTGMPCQNWTVSGSETAPQGYKYKDKELDDGTVKTAVWKPGKLLKIVLKGKGPTVPGLDFDLQVGVAQSPVDATLRSGGRRVCLRCADTKGKDGSDGKMFQGKDPDCPAPTACVGSASGAFLDRIP